MICRIHNKLPQNHVGFGTPEISTHLHNLHCGSESDGFPGDYYCPTKHGPTLSANGEFKDHLYSNVKAGFEARQDLVGDPTEALGTLFYHDHTLDFTAPNLCSTSWIQVTRRIRTLMRYGYPAIHTTIR
jgi:hypothetical protein